MITIYQNEKVENWEFSTLIEKMRKNSFKEYFDNASKLVKKDDKINYINENLSKYLPSFFKDSTNKSNFNGVLAFYCSTPLEDKIAEIKSDKYIFVCYRSHGRKSLFILVRIESKNSKEIRAINDEIETYLKEKYAIDILSCGKEAIEVSNDENAYYNPMASVFPYQASKLDSLESTKKVINQISKSEIEFMKPILTRKLENIIFPNSINIIQGKSGVHKSRLAQHFVSTFLKENNDFSDALLGLDAKQTVNVVYVDTERSIKEQFPKAIQEIRLNAGFNKEHEITDFDFTSLINIPRGERLSMTKSYINEQRKKTGKHIVFVLDIATDFIKNFNDVEESMELVDFLNETINNANVTFILVIHENPNTQFDKARGHLGTELMNKASSQLSIKEETEIEGTMYYKVSYLKCRNSKKYPAFYVKFNEANQRLEEVGNNELKAIKDARNTKANVNDVAEFIAEIWEDNISKKDLIAKINAEFDCKEKTARERLDEIEQTPIPILNSNGVSHKLIRLKGNPVIYGLKPLNNEIETEITE